MTKKYSVHILNEMFASESIFETIHLNEALEKVEETYQDAQTKCIIVTHPEDVVN